MAVKKKAHKKLNNNQKSQSKFKSCFDIAY